MTTAQLRKLHEIEQRRIDTVMKKILALTKELHTSCPVCSYANKNLGVFCGHPINSRASSSCPVQPRCAEFLRITGNLLRACETAHVELIDLHHSIGHPCEHEWTADQDNQCNVCIRCHAEKDHFV